MRSSAINEIFIQNTKEYYTFCNNYTTVSNNQFNYIDSQYTNNESGLDIISRDFAQYTIIHDQRCYAHPSYMDYT